MASQPGVRRRAPSRHLEWWTKPRVIEGLVKFYRDFGVAPLDTHSYAERQQFTGVIRNGRSSGKGWENKYPSFYGVLKHFATFREAWRAVAEAHPDLDIYLDRFCEPWEVVEDWYLLNAVGIIPLEEIARDLQRTYAGCRRRLYDLGGEARAAHGFNPVSSKHRWGCTVLRAAQFLRLRPDRLAKYINYGELPVFRGNKYIYLNPADLLVVREIDWTREDLLDPVLVRWMRACLMQRLCKLLLYGDYRSREIYKLQPVVRRRREMTEYQRRAAKNLQIPLPNDLRENDSVCLREAVAHAPQVRAGRVGRIVRIYYAEAKRRLPRHRRDPSPAGWRAVVEFAKTHTGGVVTERVRYTFLLDTLRRAEAVDENIKPRPREKETRVPRLRQNREANERRAQERFRELNEGSQLT